MEYESLPCKGGPLDGQSRPLVGLELICPEEHAASPHGIRNHRYFLVQNRITGAQWWHSEHTELPC